MEWVRMTETLSDLPQTYKDAWIRRHSKFVQSGKWEGTPESTYTQYGNFYPEFIKIVSISFGLYDYRPSDEFKEQTKILTKTSSNEYELLEYASKILSKSGFPLVGYGIKRFDIPYLAKRFAINDLTVPSSLNFNGVEPWKHTAIDLIEKWGFGCRDESVTPLDWVLTALNIETSKNSEVTGSNMTDFFYEFEHDKKQLDKIGLYCEADVNATIKLFEKFKELNIL